MTTQLVHISDCTLRDARQSPGVYLTPDEGATIADHLVSLGIDEVEAGIATGQPAEQEFIQAVGERLRGRAQLSAVYFCLGSHSIADSLAFLRDCGCGTICISIPTSPQFIAAKLGRSFRATSVLMTKAVSAAVACGFEVAFTGEDAARADINDLKEYVRLGAAAGASRFRFAESVACLEPQQMHARIAELVAASPIPVEIHCHSAYGLATANSVAALNAGATWVSVTVDGIGERGGNTPLAPLLMYLYRFRGQTHFKPEGLKALSRYVATVTKLAFHRFTPMVGDNAFTYEIAKQYESHTIYEDYPPELVGGTRELILGNKCDPETVKFVAEKYALDPAHICNLISQVVKSDRRPVRLQEVPTLFEKDQNYASK